LLVRVPDTVVASPTIGELKEHDEP
jgi:hypothetical protein